MSLPKRELPRPSSLPIAVDELYGVMRLRAFKSTGFPVNILAEDDGTVRGQLILHDGTTQRRARSETNGALIASLYGKDEASNQDALRTDPNRILWVRRRRELVQKDNTAVPSSDGILLDGSAVLAATGVYEITFDVVNTDGTNNVTVDIYVDLAAGGSAAAAEYVMRSVVIPAGGTSGEYRLTMAADDDIRGVAGAADDAAVRWIRIERIDVGA